MEGWQVQHINKNLSRLVQPTTCSIRLISSLRSIGIVSQEEFERLIAVKKSQGEFFEALRLYDILVKRKNGYRALLEALQKSNQTGAVEILLPGSDKPQSSSTFPADKIIVSPELQTGWTEWETIQTNPCFHRLFQTIKFTPDFYKCFRDKQLITDKEEATLVINSKMCMLNLIYVDFKDVLEASCQAAASDIWLGTYQGGKKLSQNNCSNLCLAELIQHNLDDDVMQTLRLYFYRNQQNERSLENILMLREQKIITIDILKRAFEELNQSGVVALLGEIQAESIVVYVLEDRSKYKGDSESCEKVYDQETHRERAKEEKFPNTPYNDDSFDNDKSGEEGGHPGSSGSGSDQPGKGGPGKDGNGDDRTGKFSEEDSRFEDDEQESDEDELEIDGKKSCEHEANLKTSTAKLCNKKTATLPIINVTNAHTVVIFNDAKLNTASFQEVLGTLHVPLVTKTMKTRQFYDFNRALVVKLAKRGPDEPLRSRHPERYKLDQDSRGVAILVNVTSFTNSSRTRDGAQVDTDLLGNLFKLFNISVWTFPSKSKHGFLTRKDLTDILQIRLRKIFENQSPSCLFVFIGSHMIKGVVELSDGSTFGLHSDFLQIIHDQVGAIPKIFLVEGCREKEIPGQLPSYTDTIICYSTLPGKTSSRDPYLGSLYIRALAEVLMREAYRLDLESMLEEVMIQIITYLQKQKGSKVKNFQISNYIKFRFNKKFYFYLS